MPGKRLTVKFINAHCATVTGYGSRDLLTEMRGGRAPVWSARGWVTVPDTAADLIAIAERRGFDVTVLESSPRGQR